MFCDADGVFYNIPHDCNKPEQHWESRILSTMYPGIRRIAIDASRNPCHAEWPYPDDSLTPAEGEDWFVTAKYAIGQQIEFTLNEATPQYPAGKSLTGTILSPHIVLNDWYVSFPTPDGWLFHRVVNERDFK
jgi:hypothetical protein